VGAVAALPRLHLWYEVLDGTWFQPVGVEVALPSLLAHLLAQSLALSWAPSLLARPWPVAAVVALLLVLEVAEAVALASAPLPRR
jgi:hypothetical protein